MYLKELKQKVHTTKPPIRVIPCSEQEVAVLEENLNLKLPMAYKEFLLWMGKDGGPIMVGSSCFYKDVFVIQAGAAELLEENLFPMPLPTDALVVWMHQGYQFAFVRISERDNPAVYYYTETRNQQVFELIYDHYTDFLTANVEASLHSWIQHPNWYSDFGRK